MSARPDDPRSEKLREADARARVLAQRQYDRPLVVEAGAGTGKTTALVARIVVWCLGPGWSLALARGEGRDEGPDRVAARVLGGVVAITFTEKAAAEMASRIGAALLAIGRGERLEWLDVETLPGGETRALRARALRRALDHLAVSTIHAWCRRILADGALEVGLHPHLEVDADGRERERVVRAVMDEALETAFVEPIDPALSTLLGHGVGPREIEAELLGWVEAGARSSVLADDPLAPERIGAWAGRGLALHAAFVDAEGGALQSAGGRGADAALRIAAAAARLADDPPRDRDTLVASLAWLVDWPPGEWRRLADWSRDRFGKREAEALGERRGAVAARAAKLAGWIAAVAEVDVDRLEAARAVLAPLLVRVEQRMRFAGVATFGDLLEETRVLLATRPAFCERLRARVDQLLVDEFQDTDECQCEIVRTLCLRGPRERRPGLFAVGDPKQSIYGWRNADLAAYERFVAAVVEQGGQLERLSVNFRSVPAVLDEVERVIGPAMQEVSGLQPAFESLVAHREALAGPNAAAVEHWVSTSPDAAVVDAGPTPLRGADATTLEAAALARDLRVLHDEHGVAWPSIGVLFRGRSDWDVYLAALREAGVPFSAEGDRSYFRRREVIDAASLVRCVLDPNDALALLAHIRSPAVGVPDAALVPLWALGLPARLGALQGEAARGCQKLCDDVRAVARTVAPTPGLERVEGWEESLVTAIRTVAALRACYEVDAPDVFVEKLRARTAIEASAAVRHLGAWRCANLDRFFRNLLDALVAGEPREEMLRRLRSEVESERDAEEGRPLALVDDAVSVMTIHAAKGLDFDHVYLVQLHKGSAPGGASLAAPAPADPDPSARRDAPGRTGSWEYRLLGAPSLGWEGVAARAARVEEAERTRLLYVAMTRARDRLVLAGARIRDLARTPTGALGALLAARERTPDLDEMLAGAVAHARDGAIDADGVHWRFPALFAARPASPSPAPIAVPAASVPPVRELGPLRERARRRAIRPFSTSATDPSAAVGAGASTDTGRSRPRGLPRVDRATARAVGTAIHRVLETLDLQADPATERERQRIAVARHAERETRGDVEMARSEALAVFDRVFDGPLVGRLWSLADRVVARELPVLLPPEASEDDEGPTGFVSGSLDLLYRDPVTDELVVVDYKTERVEGVEGIDPARLASPAHLAQGAVYQRAIREALQLAYTPRFELWFLLIDRVVACDPPRAA